MESCYEYGARAGFWRFHRLFTSRQIQVTVYGVTDAMARSPEQVWAMQEARWEIASHGKKWIEHKDMPEAEERAAMRAAIALHAEITGEAPKGWYTGRCSMNTVRLAAELGLTWVSDTIDDDLPYWRNFGQHRTLVIPYAMDTNDMRFAGPATFGGTDEFYEYLKATFDVLYAEGQVGSPKMFSVAIHCRLLGRAGRLAGLQKFLDYIAGFDGVWCPRRIDIAEHWARRHPAVEAGLLPSEMDLETFVAAFGSAFEGASWVAERAWQLELGPAHDQPVGLWNALVRAFRAASERERRAAVATSQASRAEAVVDLQLDNALREACRALERSAFARVRAALAERGHAILGG